MLARFPVHPLLLAAYFVLFLYAANLSEVLLVDAEAPLVRTVLGALAVMAGCALAFRDVRRGAIVASALVVAFLGFGHVEGLLGDRAPDDRAQLAGWAVVVLGAAAYAARARSVALATSGLNALAIVLVLLVAATIVPYEVSRAARPQIVLAGSAIVSRDAIERRDIYYLVFDRYGSADALERRFDITDNDLYGWLEDRGFQVPSRSRAAYRATDFSLASTLNMRYLDDLTAEVGRDSDDRTPAHRLLQEHEVGRFLKAQGYRYYHVGSWFGPTASNPLADESLSLEITSEFETVFRDTTILPVIDRMIGTPSADTTFRDRHRESSLFGFRQVPRLATAPGPKFVFAHFLLPHDPYVFRADGSILTEEEARAADEAELYAEQLEFTNAHIKELVDDLLSGPDASDPVVIIQADEGPLMCRNVDCPAVTAEYATVRFGILNAMYLPGVDEPLPSTFTAVNTFRTVFREYFAADLDPLPDHSYTWPDNDHVYDFRDVTELIEGGG